MRTWNACSVLLRAFACVAAVVLLSAPAFGNDSVALQMRKVAGARAYVITVDLNDSRIVVEIAIPAKGIRHSESFGRFVKRTEPVAAVTGTYFDTRTLYPVGSIVTGGKKVFEGAIGTAVCFVRPEKIECVSASDSVALPVRQSYTVRFIEKRKGEACDWSGVECGMRTGPRLLSEGRFVLKAGREGFRHPGLFGRRARMAMGLTASNKLLLVAIRTPVTFARTATVMKVLGAVEAVCLDGGSSSAMYYGGRLVCSPGRALTNVIQIRYAEPSGPAVAVVPIASTSPNPSFARRGEGEGRPVAPQVWYHRSPALPTIAGSECEQHAVLLDPLALRLAKSRRAFAPVDGAQLPGLKRLKHANDFVNVAADTQVVHHLIS